MPENHEFCFEIGQMIPRVCRDEIQHTLRTVFEESMNGERGRIYFCPAGRDFGVAALMNLKQTLKRESGDLLRFDIEAPIYQGEDEERYSLTNVIIELK